MGSGDAVVQWQHDVDLHNIAEKRDEIDRVLDGAAPDRLVVDLAGLDFVDSLGLGVLIHARERCSDLEVAMVLRHVPERTTKLLAAAGLDTLFTVEP